MWSGKLLILTLFILVVHKNFAYDGIEQPRKDTLVYASQRLMLAYMESLKDDPKIGEIEQEGIEVIKNKFDSTAWFAPINSFGSLLMTYNWNKANEFYGYLEAKSDSLSTLNSEQVPIDALFSYLKSYQNNDSGKRVYDNTSKIKQGFDNEFLIIKNQLLFNLQHQNNSRIEENSEADVNSIPTKTVESRPDAIWPDLLLYILIFLVLLSCIANFLLWRSHKRLKENFYHSAYKAEQTIWNPKSFENSFLQFEKEIKNIREEINKQNKRSEKSFSEEAEFSAGENLLEGREFMLSPTISSKNTADSKPKIKKYFQGPFEDRHFAVADEKDIKDPRCIYRIEKETEEAITGELFIDPTHQNLELIKNYADTLLKTACDFENSFRPDFKQIIQLKPGRVEKNGETWVIKEKVQIKFDTL